MTGFFDMHCHMLFGVDDGARNFDTAATMLDMAYVDGIRSICLTPHRNPYDGRRYGGNIETAFNALKNYSDEKGYNINFALGSEIMFYCDFAEDIEKGVCRTLCGGKHVLLEFSESADITEITNSAGWALSKGFIPVIAHAERYSAVLNNPYSLDELCNCGYVLQFNASLFDGTARGCFFDKLKLKKLMKYILSQRLPFIPATDAHNEKKRPPVISDAYGAVAAKCGKSYADEMFFEYPEHIFYGK